MSNVHTTDETSIEFVDIHASDPAEFTEALLERWFDEIHEGGDTNISIVHTEDMGDRRVYVVRVETTH